MAFRRAERRLIVIAGLIVRIAIHAVEQGNQPIGGIEGETCRSLDFGSHVDRLG